MRQLTSFITIFSFFIYTTIAVVPSVAYAQDPPSGNDDSSQTERVTTLRLGDPAPYPGTLFSTAAAARLLTNLEFTQEQCQNETTRQLGLQRATLQLQIDTITASRNALQLRYDETLALKNGQIQFLEDRLRPTPWYETTEFGIVIGLVIGVGVTVATGYALGQVNN